MYYCICMYYCIYYCMYYCICMYYCVYVCIIVYMYVLIYILLYTYMMLPFRLSSYFSSLPYFRQMDQARSRLSKDKIYAEKILFLRSLTNKKDIKDYIQSLRVSSIDDCDALFLIEHQQFLSEQTQRIKSSLMHHSKVNNIVVLFLLAQVFNFFDSPACINALFSKFNSTKVRFKGSELCFCLETMRKIEDCKKKINLRKMRRGLKAIKNPVHSVQISYHLLKLGICLPLFTNMVRFATWMREIETQHSLSFKTIFYLHEVGNHFQLPLNPNLAKRIKDRMLFAIRGYDVTEFDPQFLVFVLRYYPQFASCMSKATFTPSSYVDYLEYLITHHSNQTVDQEIPPRVIQTCSKAKFRRIIELQLKLNLANQMKLVRQMKSFFTYSLSCVEALLQYILFIEAEDDQMWITIEQTLTNKLRLNQSFQLNIFESYDISAVMRVFALLFRQHQSSFGFTKLVLDFFSECTLEPMIFEAVAQEERPQLSISCFKIIGKRIINSVSFGNVVQHTVESLQTQKWDYTDLKQFIKTLTDNRVGEEKIWFLLERQVFLICQNGAFRKRVIEEIVPLFKEMKKISYEMVICINNINKELTAEKELAITNSKEKEVKPKEIKKKKKKVKELTIEHSDISQEKQICLKRIKKIKKFKRHKRMKQKRQLKKTLDK